MNVYFVVTEGGEMFVREDMLDFYARHSDVSFQVYTNGTLIDKKMAALVELAPSPVNDNLSIPLCSALAMAMTS